MQRAPLSDETLCAVIDEWFRADSSRRSLVACGADGAPCLVNRAAFYEALAGRLGFGWSLFHDAPLAKLLDRVTPGKIVDAGLSLVEAGLELLSSGQVDSEQDVMVVWEDGRVGTLAISEVLGELVRAHADQVDRLESSERRFRALVQNSFDVLIVLNVDGEITYASPSAREIFGIDPDALVGRMILDHLDTDDLEGLVALIEESQAAPGVALSGQLRLWRSEDRWGSYELSLRNLVHTPEVGGIVLHCRDVTERRELEDQLRHEALHDSLTGMPNRSYVVERASELLARASREGRAVTAMFLDLDRFKDVNDTLGHAAGDELLILVGERLTDALRDAFAVGRLGGDEFVVLLDRADDAEEIAGRLLTLFEEPFRVDRRSWSVSCSIGVATGEHEGVEELLKHADIALYEAKSSGRSRYVIFDPEMRDELEFRIALERDLVSALELGEFFLVYQPTYSLADLHLLGFEALIRWRHPRRGVLYPDEFIPALESTGMIGAAGRLVLETACREAASWEQSDEVSISVNISARQLEDDSLYDLVREVLADSGLDPARLILELTESTLMGDAVATERRLSRLKELGLRVAVDDLGTGYSSLSYLQQFPIDVLKIDRSFISRLGESGSDALVHTLVQLGENLGMETLAEGIETEFQLEVLQREHCGAGQGFLLGMPLEVSALPPILGERFWAPGSSRAA